MDPLLEVLDMSSSDDLEAGSTSETTAIGDDGIDPTALDCLDGIAIKPAEMSVSRAAELPFERVTIDYEGIEHYPDRRVLESLADGREVRVTVPVRADGFDPLGDDGHLADLPEGLQTVLVAGHPAYLSERERSRAIAPRFAAAMDLAPDSWVGTEGVERIALATGATQFELLSNTTPTDVRALRAAGFTGEIAIYAPTVLTDDADAVLDAVGAYVARRKRVADQLPATAETDSRATGEGRDILLQAAHEYALVGSRATIRDRIHLLRDAGADTIVGYPARGLEDFAV